MRRAAGIALIAVVLAALVPDGAGAQRAGRAAIGGGVGIAGGVGVTLAVITARTHFQNEYLHAVEDLIHWQSTPMIAAPVAGIVFGPAGEDELRGSIVGSVTGMALGAGLGAGVGRLVSDRPEAPWAGAIIGGGVGLAIGGILGGVLAWTDDGGSGPPSPAMQLVLVRVPL